MPSSQALRDAGEFVTKVGVTKKHLGERHKYRLLSCTSSPI
jgi:hypothetical protein